MSSRDDNWDDYIDSRIDKLRTVGFNLEAFYLAAATVEHTLQKAIQLQEAWARKVLSRTGIKFVPTPKKKLEDMTLGRLISLFSRYTDEEKLIQDLNKFNFLRKTFVHKLLDYRIDGLDVIAKREFSTYWRVVAKTHRYMIWINKKSIRSTKREIKLLSRAHEAKETNPSSK